MWNLLLLLVIALTLTHGFQIQPLLIRASKTVLLGAQDGNHDDEPDFFVTRRQAIATTTTNAVLATTTAPAAHAVITSKLTTRTNVQYLEAEYADSVNTNGAPEKHLPIVTTSQEATNDKHEKSVLAQVPHVMDPEKPHFIEYMWIKNVDSGECLACQAFKATDPSPPSISATIKKGTTIKAFLFCNLHGLWQGNEVMV